MSTKIALVKNPHSTLPSALTVIEDPNVAPHVMLLRTENWEVEVDVKSGTLHKRKRIKFEPLPDFGTHMTWDEFSEMVAGGDIEDDDGSGNYATATQISNLTASLAHVAKQLPAGFVIDVDEHGHADIPKTKPPHDWVTHVVWFNK
jgi:hypothetical protein